MFCFFISRMSPQHDTHVDEADEEEDTDGTGWDTLTEVQQTPTGPVHYQNVQHNGLHHINITTFQKNLAGVQHFDHFFKNNFREKNSWRGILRILTVSRREN